MPSLRARLAVGLSVGLVIALLVQWFAVNSALEYLLINNATDHLEDDAELVLTALRLDSSGQIIVDNTRLEGRYQRPFSGRYFDVRVNNVTTRSRSLWDQTLDVPVLALGANERREAPGPAQQQLLQVTRGFRKYDQDVLITVAEDIAPLRADIRRFQLRFAILAVAILCVLVGLHLWWVKRGLKPLDAVRSELRALEKGAIRHLTVTHVPTEVQPLVLQINRLLEAIQRRLERSRNALGNLAHALKTPLTAMMQNFERPEITANKELHDSLQRHTNIVRELIERELKRARVVGSGVPTQEYDVAVEIESLVNTLRMVYREKTLDIITRIPADAQCPIDREDLFELLGNLLDNACKWARARVCITVLSGPRWICTVEDDGPGAPQQEIEKLTGRGVRIDESTAGHGLGLAIAKDLVAHYGGNLFLSRSQEFGGFCARATLPMEMSPEGD